MKLFVIALVAAVVFTTISTLSSMAIGQEENYDLVRCSHVNVVDNPSCEVLCGLAASYFGASFDGSAWDMTYCNCTLGFGFFNFTEAFCDELGAGEEPFDCAEYNIYDDFSCNMFCETIGDNSGSFSTEGNGNYSANCICDTSNGDKNLCFSPYYEAYNEDEEGGSLFTGNISCAAIEVSTARQCTEFCEDLLDLESGSVTGTINDVGCNCTSTSSSPVAFNNQVCSRQVDTTHLVNMLLNALSLPATCQQPFRNAMTPEFFRCGFSGQLEIDEVDEYYREGHDHDDDDEDEERLEDSVIGLQFTEATCMDPCIRTFLESTRILRNSNCLSALNFTNFDDEHDDNRRREEFSSTGLPDHETESASRSEIEGVGDFFESLGRLYRLVPLLNLYCTEGGNGNCGELSSVFRAINSTSVTAGDCTLINERGFCLGSFRAHLNERLAGSGDMFASDVVSACSAVNVDVTSASTGTEAPGTLSGGFFVASSVVGVAIASLVAALFLLF
eukprot:m.92841 g.92841  ORF g.92841 m.92841 type:complete len:503 (+) comp12371_c1_seq2:72-1580(+)